VWSWARCIGIGLVLGVVIGVALHSYTLGIIIGVGFGAALCLVSKRRERGEQN
jgi:galactitol-specific phosphotransferase system IIC component